MTEKLNLAPDPEETKYRENLRRLEEWARQLVAELNTKDEQVPQNRFLLMGS